MVSHLQDKTQTDGVWEQGAEEDTWNQTDITEGWTELHSQEPYDLYSLQILRAITPQTILCV
jgi:hypothetical protein